MSTGRDKFKDGLNKLGYVTEDRNDSWVIIKDYYIEKGRFGGTKIELAFDVHADFELTPPHGPHVKPILFPINQSSTNHEERMHKSPLGEDWGLLSRPFQNWENTDRSVREYMRYIKHLLEIL